MAKYHTEWKLLDSIKDAAEKALELIDTCQDMEQDIKILKDDIEIAQDYIREGDDVAGHTEDLEKAIKDLAEATEEFTKLDQERQDAFDWFRCVSGIDLDA